MSLLKHTVIGTAPEVLQSETTPLLADELPSAVSKSGDIAEESRNSSDEDKPLPIVQVGLLCFTRVLEPIAYFSIFPYIAQMIQSNGNLPEAEVGFYAGLIESLFSLTQMTVMVAWGRAADRFGRKPVLTLSLVGIAVATALFGFSKHIWQMVLFRCTAGVFAGTVVTVRTMISEHSTAKTQARSFSWFAFAGNLGIFLGPLLGGAFAEPAKQYPSLFGNVQLFRDYPYALPSLVCGGVGALAALISGLFIDETLVKKDTPGHTAMPAASIEDILRSPGVGMVLYLYSHLMLIAFAFTAINPVFAFTAVKLGGFGFSELQISLYMAVAGLSQAIWVLVIFPPLQHRVGTGGILRGAAIGYAIWLAAFPFFNLLLREGSREAWIVFWTIGPIFAAVGSGVSMAFTAIQLALNDVCPSPQVLGTTNSIALAMVSGIRSFAPVVGTSIFAWGVKYQIIWGYLAWVVLVVVGVLYIIALRWLPKNAEGKLARREENDPEEQAN